jgi:hypothetical protein
MSIRRPVMKTCAPSLTNRSAAANRIPVVPPWILHLQRESKGLTAPDCSRQSRTERIRKRSHRLIVVENIAAEATHAREARALRQDSRKHGSETDSAPIVGDHKSELSGIRIGVTNEASFRNERRELTRSAIVDLCDECNVSTIIEHRELVQEVLRELLDRTVKSKPKGRARQRHKECPQGIQIRRPDRADRNESRVVEL